MKSTLKYNIIRVSYKFILTMEPSFLFFKIPLYLARTPRYRAFRSRNEPFFLRVTRIKKTSGRDNVVVLVVSHKSGRIAPLGMNRAAFLRLPIIRLCLKEADRGDSFREERWKNSFIGIDRYRSLSNWKLLRNAPFSAFRLQSIPFHP